MTKQNANFDATACKFLGTITYMTVHFKYIAIKVIFSNFAKSSCSNDSMFLFELFQTLKNTSIFEGYKIYFVLCKTISI